MSDEGRLVAGRYRVQRRIGSGAMGVVWECIDERLHRTVAVKQLLLQPGLDPGEAEEARQRAMREGRIAARLQHPNAISVYDVAEDEGQPVLVMEYLPSTSLAAMMSEHGPLPPREVARIGAQVADALGAAHAAGVVHRDIKPGNILLGDNGTVKIADFGISRAQGDDKVTKTGMLAGTPAYLSPDVAMGQEPSGASDVFSLGATLYAAIEGHPPFGLNENTLALLHAVAAGKIEPPQQSGPMSAPLMAMMHTRVEDRPDMAQVREMLQTVTDGHTVTSVPTTAAPIPPAFAPGEGSQPDLTPTSVAGPDRTAVAHAGQFYDENPYRDDYEHPTSYMGSDPRGDAALHERPKKSKKPVFVSSVVLVAAAVIGVIAITALTNNVGPAQETGNRPSPSSEHNAPPPPSPTSEPETEYSEPVEEEPPPVTSEPSEPPEDTSSLVPTPPSSEVPPPTSDDSDTSEPSEEPTSSEEETSVPTSGLISTQQQPAGN